jgi:hypothetical protein
MYLSITSSSFEEQWVSYPLISSWTRHGEIRVKAALIIEILEVVIARSICEVVEGAKYDVE